MYVSNLKNWNIFRLITIVTDDVDLLLHSQDDSLLKRYLSGKKPISKLKGPISIPGTPPVQKILIKKNNIANIMENRGCSISRD